MPLGYLADVALLAIGTLVALVPARRPRFLANVSFFFGLYVNELPLVAICVLVASTLLALGQGDIDSVGAWLTVAIAAITTIGLVVIAGRALSARPTIERALRDKLGSDWRGAIDPGLRAGPDRTRIPVARVLFAPFTFARRDVSRIKDITYGPAGRSNLLDVYRHRSRPPGGPMLIHFHGGHFRWGRKSRDSRALFYRLASHGWVCVSANYRLGRAATFPDHLVDAKRVIAWVRVHGADHGGDPTTVFIAGSSAGGHMAAMAALTPNNARFQPGFEQIDTSVTAAIPLGGYFGPIESRDGSPSSPFDYVGPAAPPFFVAHGDLDTVVPVELARAFVDALEVAGAKRVVYAELRGGQHSFDVFHSIRFELVIEGIEGFAAWVRSQRPAHSPGS